MGHSFKIHPVTRLKELRLRKGWTQEETAKRLGTSRHSIRAWERGGRSPTRIARNAIEQFIDDNN